MRRRSEAGLTLVEMLVAMFVIAILLTAMASVAIGSMRAVQSNEREVRSTQLGNDLLESLRAVPYDLVGHYESDALAHFGAATHDGEDLVVIADPADPTDRDDRVPDAAWTEHRDGIDYDVELAVTWVDDTATAEAQDYKRISVTLSWDLRGETRTETVEAIRAPASDDQPLAATVTPDVIPLTTGGNTQSSFDLFVQAKVPQIDVKVSWVDADGTSEFRYMNYEDTDRLEWRLHFSASSGPFENGETLFTVEGVDENDDPIVTTIGRGLFLYPLAFDPTDDTQLTLDPETLRYHPDTGLCSGLTIQDLHVTGATSSDGVTVTHDTLTHALAVHDTLTSNSGTWFWGGLDEDELAVTSTTTSIDLVLEVERPADEDTFTATITVPVEVLSADADEDGVVDPC